MYNAASWIVRCLESVANQSFTDWECIVVDNNSKDNSLVVAREYVKSIDKEGQFRFINLPVNGGPGSARNAGIEVAQGCYIAFLDADDWLEPDIYERLYSHTADSPDIVLGNTSLPTSVTRNRLLRNYPPSSCFHLYRREFVLENNLSFPPERTSEDSYFVATCILMAKTWTTTTDYGYVIFKNPDSVSRRIDPERYRLKLQVFTRLLDFAEERGVKDANHGALRQIFIRKAMLMSLREYLANNRPLRLSQITEIIRYSLRQLNRL